MLYRLNFHFEGGRQLSADAGGDFRHAQHSAAATARRRRRQADALHDSGPVRYRAPKMAIDVDARYFAMSRGPYVAT